MKTRGVRRSDTVYLVTGATGFLGKVVLSELMRRREMLGVAQVLLLIRSRGDLKAKDRFLQKLVPSPCFRRLPRGWEKRVEVIDADLSLDRAGIREETLAPWLGKVTHIIHCAASVDFDRPVREACASNITSALTVLELARRMPQLCKMVSTSTAYVTPHRAGPILEELALLPRPAEVLYAEMQREAGHGDALLRETGHANTYTYTKCVAEHLLLERARGVPVEIVRPSIISASLLHPVPGWIDSKAAFAGFVATIGAGYLRLIDGDPQVLLDVVPVDYVTDCLIQASQNTRTDASPIRHATAGVHKASLIGATSESIVAFFRRNPAARRAGLSYLGRRTAWFRFLEKVQHDAPAKMMASYYTVTRNERQRSKVRRMKQTLRTINRVFPYFTHHTFDFRSRHQLPDCFYAQPYVQLVCRGVSTHLLHLNAREVCVAGQARTHRGPLGRLHKSFSWRHILRQLSTSAAERLLNRVFERVTFDRESFDSAQAAHKAVGAEFPVVFVPTHRSYLDFVVLGHLFGTRSDLGFEAPRPAVLEHVLALPFFGAWLRRLGAFAGGGRSRPQLAETLQRALREARPLQLFLEGTRSRSRAFGLPQREVLQALADVGTPVAIVPLGISYERIAEEALFLREARGRPAKRLTQNSLASWLRRAFSGQVRLGHVHVAAADPIILRGGATVEEVRRQIVVAQRGATVVTPYHLDAFLARHPALHVGRAGLAQALLQRDGKLLTPHRKKGAAPFLSTLLDDLQERNLRKQWDHLFVVDACQKDMTNPALLAYAYELGLTTQDFHEAPGDVSGELLVALFASYVREYADLCLAFVGYAERGERHVQEQEILRQVAFVDLESAKLTLDDLLRANLVRRAPNEGELMVYEIVGSPTEFSSRAVRARNFVNREIIAHKNNSVPTSIQKP